MVAKQSSIAYDTGEAVSHLVRQLAAELATLIHVYSLAPATIVEGSRMFLCDHATSSLHKYNVPFDESESTGSLRNKLANYYGQ